MSEVVLRMEHIVKEFPGVRALDNVNFEARAGEVLALMGENGAGKSTLMKVLGGVWPYPTYQGDIFIEGEKKRFYNTREAEESGVAIIYQELNLIPELSVAENIFLDRQPANRFGAIDWRELNSDTQALLDELGIRDFKPADQVRSLTVGKQQMVEIAKALSKRARILVLDEPTSALTDREVTELFRIVRKLKQDGVCMCYISHKMEEIKEIADRVVVLRDGQTIGDVTPVADVTLDQIIARMVGRDIRDMFPKSVRKRGDKILEVRNLEVDHPDLPGEKRVKRASFSAYRGEILGISGLMGAGRTELTEDRKAQGLFMDQSIAFNTTISSLQTVSAGMLGRIDADRERTLVEQYVAQLNVKARGIDTPVGMLSGGNQQKVILGKWLNAGPKIFILDEPTRGIDIGAKVEIYKLLDRLAGEGVAIIIISSELSEVLGMSDRILVMSEGAIVSEFTREEASREVIMEFATGARRMGH
jgi:D-xylose transport system ATP-binding protein